MDRYDVFRLIILDTIKFPPYKKCNAEFSAQIYQCLLYLNGFLPDEFYFVNQGVAMPAMNNLLSKWIPVSERSRSLALVYSGMYLGSVTGLAVSPALIHKFGWPSVFYSFGSLGSIWFALWWSKVRPHFFLLLLFN